MASRYGQLFKYIKNNIVSETTCKSSLKRDLRLAGEINKYVIAIFYRY